MGKVVFHPDGLRDVEREFVNTELDHRGNKVLISALANCPVKTGYLKSTLDKESGSDHQGPYVNVGAGASYAQHVEFRRPYLRPALDAARD